MTFKARNLIAVLMIAVIAFAAFVVVHRVDEQRTVDEQVAQAAIWTLFVTVFLAAYPMVISVHSWWQEGRKAADSSHQILSASQLAEVADKLSTQTQKQWEEEAYVRGVTIPQPIPVKWHLDTMRSLPVGELFVGSKKNEDIPGGSSQGGLITELYDLLYNRLQHRQLVITGKTGAGKTAAMLLLMLEALKQRSEELSPEKRSAIPVPVWLTLGGWSADEQSLMEYAASAIERDYPFLRGVGTGVSDALLAEEKVALFLDGLDDMPSSAKSTALSKIDKEAHRLKVVITSTSAEYGRARATGRISYPAVVSLRPLDLKSISEYLTQGHDGSQERDRWDTFTKYLVEHPGSPVARALDNPLMLSLCRASYRQSGDPTELTEFKGIKQVKRFLISEFLTAAYPDPEERSQAVRWLAWTARRMGRSRDLRWWDIPTWIPRKVLISRAGMIFGVVSGVSSAVGLEVAGSHALRLSIGGHLISGIATAITMGACIGFAIGRLIAPIYVRNVSPLSTRGPRIPLIPRISLRDIPSLIWCGLVCALVFGGGNYLVSSAGKNFPNWVSHQPGLGGGLVAGFVAGIAIWLAILGAKPVADLKAVSPIRAYRNECYNSLLTTSSVMIIAAASFGVQIGIHQGFTAGLWRGVGVSVSSAAIIWLVLGGLTPAIKVTETILTVMSRRRANLMITYEKALERQVFRQVGAIYQFRHADLQDYLSSVSNEIDKIVNQ
jgi:hypothetical protein